MTDPHLTHSLLALIGAGLSGAAAKVAQAIPSTPNWLEHGALALLVGLLIYGVRILWKRNVELGEANMALGEKIDLITSRFHDEVKEEMQAQINASRTSQEKASKAVEELSKVLAELKKKLETS